MLDLAEIPTLETARLRLRRSTERDTDGLERIFANAQYTRFLGDGDTADRAAAWDVRTIKAPLAVSRNTASMSSSCRRLRHSRPLAAGLKHDKRAKSRIDPDQGTMSGSGGGS